MHLGLDSALDYVQFNREQKMIIVGSSSDSRLVSAVDYWKAQGLSIVLFRTVFI